MLDSSPMNERLNALAKTIQKRCTLHAVLTADLQEPLTEDDRKALRTMLQRIDAHVAHLEEQLHRQE